MIGVSKPLKAVTIERSVKASALVSLVETSPVRRCTTVLVSIKAVPTRMQAEKSGQRPAVLVGKMSVAAPAAAAQKIARASDGLGPERSSQRPAAMAPNAGNKATLASIAPTSKELAPCSSASSVTQKRMPVVQECKISNMNRTRASFPYITPSPYGFSRHNTDIKASLTDATPEFEREQKAFAANKKPKAQLQRFSAGYTFGMKPCQMRQLLPSLTIKMSASNQSRQPYGSWCFHLC